MGTGGEAMIGVVGGLGPYAGTDLLNKLFDQTLATADQDHLPVAMISTPHRVPDRTEFILNRRGPNPAGAIFEGVRALERIGATVVGMPCNTAHAPEIFDVLRRRLDESGSGVKLLHMVEEVGRFLRERFPEARLVGVLSTTGTWQSEVYATVLRPMGFEVLAPDEDTQTRLVHPAIHDSRYGIKACPDPVSDRARSAIVEAMDKLVDGGAEAVVLGCTELPLAVREKRHQGRPVVDSTLVLARALIREFDPAKLRPLDA